MCLVEIGLAMVEKSPDVVWHSGSVGPDERRKVTKNSPAVVWLTGLSGCGKSTIAMTLELALIRSGHPAFVLDGDNLRHGLNSDLGFSAQDRTENIRRVSEVARLFADAHIIAICSFISPYRLDRRNARNRIEPHAFLEVFVDAPLNICEQRDPKQLYRKAREKLAAGTPMGFTGIDAPYEPPENPEVHVKTDVQTVDQCVESILQTLRTRRILLQGDA